MSRDITKVANLISPGPPQSGVKEQRLRVAGYCGSKFAARRPMSGRRTADGALRREAGDRPMTGVLSCVTVARPRGSLETQLGPVAGQVTAASGLTGLPERFGQRGQRAMSDVRVGSFSRSLLQVSGRSAEARR